MIHKETAADHHFRATLVGVGLQFLADYQRPGPKFRAPRKSKPAALPHKRRKAS